MAQISINHSINAKCRTKLAFADNGDLYAISYTNTGSNHVEVTILPRSNGYKAVAAPTITYWPSWNETGSERTIVDFAIGKNGYLYSFHKSAASHEIEIHTIGGPDLSLNKLNLRTNLQNDYTNQYSFILGKQFVHPVEFGGLGYDIYAVKKFGSKSRMVELYALPRSGWDYRSFTLVAVINMSEDNTNNFSYLMLSNGDLMVISSKYAPKDGLNSPVNLKYRIYSKNSNYKHLVIARTSSFGIRTSFPSFAPTSQYPAIMPPPSAFMPSTNPGYLNTPVYKVKYLFNDSSTFLMITTFLMAIILLVICGKMRFRDRATRGRDSKILRYVKPNVILLKQNE